jgi:CRISPR-associated exonuclease Cas4
MLFLATLLFLLAIALLWQAWRRQKAIGLPSGRVIYADTRKWGPLEEPLYDPELGLVGKPDYLVEEKEKLIPVEVKSSPVSAAPYDGHIFQLAAYCLLVQRQFDKRPPYGILHYPNRTFAVDYTPELEAALLDRLEAMRAQDKRKDIQRSHDSAARCSRCGFRAVCDQRLL